MINLLPQQEKKSAVRQYYVRVLVLTSLALAGALALGALLLSPTFVLLRSEVKISAEYLETSEVSLALIERSAQGREVATLLERQNILPQYARAGVTTDIFETVLRATVPGIRITDIGYVRREEVTEVSFSGTADARSALVAFTDALRQSAAFEDVALPISSLITGEEIPFSFSLTYLHKAP